MKLEIRELSTTDSNFQQELKNLLQRGSEFDPKIDAAVAEIIKAVRERGDEALVEFTRQFDRNPIATADQLIVNADELEQAYDRLSPALKDALDRANNRIEDFHHKQSDWCYRPWRVDDGYGSTFEYEPTPIDRVGIYVPGGRAAYPSSVLMAANPVLAAGVEEIVMVVPAIEGKIKDSVLAAADLCCLDKVYAIGGAQAIAALAFGTETVPKVDKIVGPGNAWVTSAKRQVFGYVGIDMIAGPSEVVVVCDASTNAEWAAMDMFAQAEHDELAQSILLSVGRNKMDEVRDTMASLLPEMERKDIIARSLSQRGAMICVRDRKELVDVINQIAPEHVGLLTEDAENLAISIRHAGAVFIGPYSAEVFGDYCAGPSHVLPTSGTARFTSPLGVYDFIKFTSFVNCSAEAARGLAPVAGELAREEQLMAHARAADCRRTRPARRRKR